MEQPSVELVIARYREDVSWVEGLGLPAVVYDKSGAPLRPEQAAGPVAWTPLPNVGREAHTYLHHIVARYPDFADYMVFLQGDPFRHMGEGAGPETLRQRILRNVRLGVRFTGFAWYKLKCDRLGRPHAMADPEGKGRWKGWGKDIPVGEVYAELFTGQAPESFLATAPAGLLFVSKERLVSRSKCFYERCLKLVLDDPEDERNTGHAFERLWQVLFNGKTDLNKETDA